MASSSSSILQAEEVSTGSYNKTYWRPPAASQLNAKLGSTSPPSLFGEYLLDLQAVQEGSMVPKRYRGGQAEEASSMVGTEVIANEADSGIDHGSSGIVPFRVGT